MKGDKLLAEWFWTDRYDGSSAALMPMEAQGVYRSMLTQAWRRGAKLPNDHEAIQRAIRCTAEEWSRTWPRISRYWRVDGDNLVNDTQLEVYAEAKAAMDRASARGKAGAQARAQAELKRHLINTQAEPEQALEDKPPVSGLRSPESTEQQQAAPPPADLPENRNGNGHRPHRPKGPGSATLREIERLSAEPDVAHLGAAWAAALGRPKPEIGALRAVKAALLGGYARDRIDLVIRTLAQCRGSPERFNARGAFRWALEHNCSPAYVLRPETLDKLIPEAEAWWRD